MLPLILLQWAAGLPGKRAQPQQWNVAVLPLSALSYFHCASSISIPTPNIFLYLHWENAEALQFKCIVNTLLRERVFLLLLPCRLLNLPHTIVSEEHIGCAHVAEYCSTVLAPLLWKLPLLPQQVPSSLPERTWGQMHGKIHLLHCINSRVVWRIISNSDR